MVTINIHRERSMNAIPKENLQSRRIYTYATVILDLHLIGYIYKLINSSFKRSEKKSLLDFTLSRLHKVHRIFLLLLFGLVCRVLCAVYCIKRKIENAWTAPFFYLRIRGGFAARSSICGKVLEEIF